MLRTWVVPLGSAETARAHACPCTTPRLNAPADGSLWRYVTRTCYFLAPRVLLVYEQCSARSEVHLQMITRSSTEPEGARHLLRR